MLSAPTDQIKAAVRAFGRRNVTAALRAFLNQDTTDDPEDPEEDDMAGEADEKKGEPCPPCPKCAKAEADASALRARVDALEASALARQKADDAEAIERWKREAADLQAPFDASELEAMGALLAVGQRKSAQALAEGRLKVLRGAGGGRFTAPLRAAGDSADLERRKRITSETAAQLRAAGWAVELTADGSEILKQTRPPPVGGR
jgi:hypothetical protein